MKKILGIAGLLLALVAGAQADLIAGDVIKIDFGANESTDTTWNTYKINSGTLALTDQYAEDDGVTVTVTGADGNGLNNLDGSAYGGSDDADVYFDHVFDNSGGERAFTVTISGLDDDLTYDLFGGYLRDAGTFETTYTVGGTAYTYEFADGYVNAYNTYSDLSSADGVISFTVSGMTTSDIASISELTITAIPEPATIGMLGLGTVGLLAFRRRML